MTNEVFEIYNVSYSWTVEDATNLTAAEVNDTLPEYLRFNDNSLIVVLVYSALFVVAAVGNLSVFISLFRSRRRKSRISLMIRHLTIADLMVTFIMIPLEVGWRITVQWLAGNFACKVFLFLRAFGLYLSSNVLVCVSLDRYFAVLHPLRVNDARRRGKMMLAFAWGLSLLCAVPQSIVFHVSSHPKYPFFHQCVSFGLLSQKQEVAYTFFGVFAMYFLPLIVIVVAYTAIMCEIFHKSRDSREPQTNNGRMRLRRSDMTNIERARTRTLKMTIMIVVVFVWCWTPYVVMTLWYMFDWDSAAKVPTSLQDALFMMAVSNSCMNPLVYGSYAIKFPKNCCRCICCCKCQTESALNNGPTLIAEQETRLTRRLIFSVFSLYKAGSTVTRSTAINGGNRSTIVKKCNLLSKKDEKHCMNRPSSIGHISFLSERPTNRSFRSSTFHSDPSPFTGTRKHDVAHHHHSSTHPSSPKEVI